MKFSKPLGAVALVSALYGTTASSAVIGTLEFTNPTGTVGANDTIDVYVTLTLESFSDDLTFYPYDAFPNGVNPDDLPTEAWDWDSEDYVPFDSYDYIGAYVSRGCTDTFTVGCSDAGSQYSYSTDNDWFDFEGTLSAGDSLTLKLFELTPVAGGAAPGTYELFNAGFGLTVYGQDADGNPLDETLYAFDTNCAGASCTFTRDVSAVPLPAAAWLFGSAMLGLVGLSRRRSGS